MRTSDVRGIYTSQELLRIRSKGFLYVHSTKNIGNTIAFLAKSRPASQIKNIGKRVIEKRDSSMVCYLPIVDEENEKTSSNEIRSSNL
jgi:hypothetical protein